MLPLVLSSDSHVFEPPDLWQTRIDSAFRDRAPRIERIDGGDYIAVERDQILSGIGLISNTGARFEAPETISGDGLLEDVLSMIACKAAVKAGQKLAPDEVTALLERRHLVSDAHHCPHGRPTALVFTKSELERQFGRI